MYGIKDDTIFWDKVGISFLHLLIHGIVCGLVMFLAYLILRELGVYVGIFICGYISNPFVKYDILEIWRV